MRALNVTVQFVMLVVGWAGPLVQLLAIWNWLKFGVWMPVGNTWIREYDPNFNAWIARPDSWFGAHIIVSWVFTYFPLTLLSLVVLEIAFRVWWKDLMELRRRNQPDPAQPS